jgi:Fe-S-cluster-containing dehydrogenase component
MTFNQHHQSKDTEWDGDFPEHPQRRRFLKGTVGIALAASLFPGDAPAASTPKWTMVIDLNRCTGCQSCVIACKAHNDTSENQFNTCVIISESKAPESSRALFTPVQCNHCHQPPCVAACPSEATFALANGIVVTDWAKCAGDLSCLDACPFGARHADARHGNKADKCDFCLHLVERGLSPACVTACPAKARLFGNAESPDGDLATALQRVDLVGPQPRQTFATSVNYLPRRNATKQGEAR